MLDGGLHISPDRELTFTIIVEFWTNADGQFGVPLLEHFAADAALSPEQKARLAIQFASYTRTSSTRGYKVDPVSHAIVEPSPEGTFPQGAIDEKEVWLAYPASEIPGELFSEKYNSLLLKSMGDMIENKRV